MSPNSRSTRSGSGARRQWWWISTKLTSLMRGWLWPAAVVAAIFVTIGLPGPVMAQTLTMTLPAVADFQSIVLTGSATSTSAAMDDFSVGDSRETGEGWSVTVAATQFREWNGSQYVAGGRALAPGSLSMPAPTVAAVGTVSPPPIITPGPYAIDGSSIKIASAAAGTGQGTYAFTQGGPLTLTIPAAAYAATYRSEVTLSLASGP